MARTVKVDLLLDVARYLRPAREAKRETQGVAESLDDAARAGDKASTALDATAREMSDTARAAEKLDRQVDETSRSMRDLAREIAHTSDEAARADLVKKLAGEQGKHRELSSLRKLIDFDSAAGVGEQLAERASLTFAQRIGPLIARAPMAGMNPAVLAVGAPLAIGVASLLSTALAGAVVGAAGIGGVVGGLKLAAQNQQVKTAGTKLGEDLSAMLGRASAAFVPETLDAIDTIRDRAEKLEPAFTRAFNAASEHLDPLLDGLLDAGENAMPGLTEAIESAGPVIDSIADGLRDIGSAVGDSFGDMAEYADEGARALHILFKTVEAGVVGVTAMVVAFAELYGAAEKVGALITGDLPRFYSLITAQEDAGGASDGLASGLGGVGRAAGNAANKAYDLIDSLEILNGLQLNTNETEREFQRAIDDAREAFDGKTRDFKGATEKGRDYGEALDNIAVKAKESAQAIFDQTGDVDAANGKLKEGRTALYNQARQYGRTKAEAWAYVDSVLAIPKKWNTDVKLSDMASAKAKAIRSEISKIHGKTVTIDIKMETHGSMQGEHIIGQGTQLKNRWGGVYEHARDGLLRDAAIYSPMGPARYAFAEPATGGEAFIPKFGDRDRSREIWAHVGQNWLGMRPQTMAAPAASAPAPSPAVQAAAIRAALVGVSVVMDGRVVGRIQGREADMLSR